MIYSKEDRRAGVGSTLSRAVEEKMPIKFQQGPLGGGRGSDLENSLRD